METMNNLKGKKLLILGGNILTSDIVLKAKELGVYTIVTDWNTPDVSPAKKLADEYWMESLTDAEKISDLIKVHKIDGIITGFTDSYLLPYQHLCELNGLPCYATAEQFRITLDKDLFKRFCIANNVPIVPEYDIQNFDKSILSAQNRIIIKPVDNSGSRGICICDNPMEFEEKLNYSLSFSESKRVLLEKYMDCDDVSFEYKIQDGEIFLSSICDRYIYKTSALGSVTSKLIYPSNYTDLYINEIDHKVKQMFKQLSLTNGVLFMQAFVENDNFYFYEMGFRLSGGRHFIFTENQNNTSSVKELIHFAITGKMDDNRIIEKSNPLFLNLCCQLSVLCKSEEIYKILGKEWISDTREIIDALYTYNEGDVVGAQGTSAQIAARFHIVSDDEEHLEKIIRGIKENFVVINAEGENIIIWE